MKISLPETGVQVFDIDATPEKQHTWGSPPGPISCGKQIGLSKEPIFFFPGGREFWKKWGSAISDVAHETVNSCSQFGGALLENMNEDVCYVLVGVLMIPIRLYR